MPGKEAANLMTSDVNKWRELTLNLTPVLCFNYIFLLQTRYYTELEIVIIRL